MNRMPESSFTQPPPPAGWRRWLWPLRSRKVQVALAAVLVAYAGEAGLELREETVTMVIGLGAALVLGIAYEDGARRAG
jgi:hypothetical protein